MCASFFFIHITPIDISDAIIKKREEKKDHYRKEKKERNRLLKKMYEDSIF